MALSTRSRKYMRIARHRPDDLAYQASAVCPEIGDQKCSLNACLRPQHTYCHHKLKRFTPSFLSIPPESLGYWVQTQDKDRTRHPVEGHNSKKP